MPRADVPIAREVAAHFTADEVREAESWLAEHAHEIPNSATGDTVFPDALRQRIARERVRIPRHLRKKPTVRLRTPETDRALAMARVLPPSDDELRTRQLERGLIALLDLIPYSDRSRQLVRIADLAIAGKSQREIAATLKMDRRKVARRLELIFRAGEVSSLSGLKAKDEVTAPEQVFSHGVSGTPSVSYAEKCTILEPPSDYL